MMIEIGLFEGYNGPNGWKYDNQDDIFHVFLNDDDDDVRTLSNIYNRIANGNLWS